MRCSPFDRSALTGARFNLTYRHWCPYRCQPSCSGLLVRAESHRRPSRRDPGTARGQCRPRPLDRLQQATKVILCVAGNCPTGVGVTGSTTQTGEINQAHQRLETAFVKLDAAEAKLSFDESGRR